MRWRKQGRVFGERHGAFFPRYRPVIGRLAEALARNGRFSLEDRILDVAIALERMYELPEGKISRKLRNRASRYLGTDATGREAIKSTVKDFYDGRSDIMHNRTDRVSPQRHRDSFVEGFDIARRSLFKLLRVGPPPDWIEGAIAGTTPEGGARRPGAGTTTPGYRNRNGQVVIRKTDVPGNDHNQVVYVLQCGDCDLQYGANGSDIWQRKCPGCGGGRPGLEY